MKRFLFILLMLSFLGIVNASLNDGLVAYYNVNNNDLTDQVNSYDLFNVGSTNSSGIYISGRDVNGAGQYVTTADATDLDFGTGALTVNFWLDWDDSGTDVMSKAKNSASWDDWLIRFNSGTGVLQLTFDGSNVIAGSTDLRARSWMMITWTRSAGGVNRLWVNGTQQGANATNANDLSNTYNFTIGKNLGFGSDYNGRFDEVGLWKGVELNPSQILELYNSGVGIFYPFSAVSSSSTAPTNNTVYLAGSTVSFNSTITSASNQLANVTLFINGVLNETKSISGLTAYGSFNKTFSAGNYTWFVTGCDNTNVCSNSSINQVIVRSWVQHALYYVSSSIVGTTEEFGATLNVTSGITISSANFVYNGVGYSTGIDYVGDQINLTTDFQLPSGTGNKTWYFNFSLTDSSAGTTTPTNLSLIPLAIDDCSSNTYLLYNFTVYNEISLARLNSTGDKVNISFNAQLYDSSGTVLIANYSTIKTNQNNVSLCLQNSLISGSTYLFDLELQYGASGYVNEYYYILNERIDTSDLNTSIGLYDLDNVTSQAFKITYKDASFNPVADAVIQIQRKYVGEGLSRTVEQPKTDSNGETVAHLQLNDVTYTFIIVEGGEVVATFSNYKAYCPNPTFTECEINLNALSGNVVQTDYASIGPISFTLDVNTTSKVVTSVYSIRSGSAGTVTLNVTLFDSFGTTPVCSNNLTASSGTLTCNIPNSFGNSTILARLYYNGAYIGQKIVYLGPTGSEIYGQNVVFIGIIIVFSLVGITFIGSPTIALFGLILSLIVLITLNIVASAGFIGTGATVLWFIVAIIIIMIKGANR